MQVLGMTYIKGVLTHSYATMAPNDILDRTRLNLTVAASDVGMDSALSAIPDCRICAVSLFSSILRANQDSRVRARCFRAGNATDGVSLLQLNASGNFAQYQEYRCRDCE